MHSYGFAIRVCFYHLFCKNFTHPEKLHLGIRFVFFAGPPHVRQIPPVKAIEGQTVLVACPASGYPLETILWQKGKALEGQGTI